MENQLDVTPLVVGLAINWLLFFVPAMIAKNIILPKEPITGKWKAVTMILLGIITLAIGTTISLLLTGNFPNAKPWTTWMVIDYFYLFGKRKKKEVKNAIDYDDLYAEMDEFEAEKNGANPEMKKSQLAKDNIADDAVI
jgi:hypothetical protein